MAKPRAILFDLDGTLRDTKDLIYDAVLYTLKLHGTVLTRKDIEPYIHHHSVVYQQFLSHVPWDEFDAVYKKKLHELWDEVALFPHALDTIQSLSSEGYRLAIVTSATQEGTETFLRTKGLAKFFESISGVRPGVEPKPAPDLVLDALNNLALPPEDTIMIGDMVADVEAARAAGVVCVGVTYGFADKDELVKAGAVHIVNSLTELQPYLEKLKINQE